jgi:hypothetical protein
LIRDSSNDLKCKKRRIELVFLGPKLGYNNGPFTRMIIETWILTRLEKTPQMDTYNGTTVPDEHIENIEVVLNYGNV